MDTTDPRSHRNAASQLRALGERIRARRKALHVSAVDAAQASDMSRVTLHRVERGEASVSIASYMSAISALGLELSVNEAGATKPHAPVHDESPQAPESLRLADYAQLQSVAWQMKGSTVITLEMALNLYERNWRHLDPAAMNAKELALVERLACDLPGGRLLV
jgi:transcriptional regulator with XRE-family HTH domain